MKIAMIKIAPLMTASAFFTPSCQSVSLNIQKIPIGGKIIKKKIVMRLKKNFFKGNPSLFTSFYFIKCRSVTQVMFDFFGWG